MDRMEALLRQSLEARAEDVQPDPETWNRIEARIRRGRTFRLAVAGITATAAIIVAAVALPALLNRPTVDLAPGDQPGTVAPTPAPRDGATGVCGAPPNVAAVAERGGALVAVCWDGSTRALTQGPGDGNVTFSPEGGWLLFERRGEDGGLIVHLDLAEPEQESVLGGGSLPAVGQDGRVAWVQDQPGDGVQPRIIVGERFAEPEYEIAVAEDGVEEFTVHALAFTPEGDLAYTAGYEGQGLWLVPLSDAADTPELQSAREGTTFVALAPGPRGLAAAEACCMTVEGDRPERFRVGDLQPGDGLAGFTPHVDLGAVPDFDVDGAVMVSSTWGLGLTEDGSALRHSDDGFEWWVVSDGAHAWFVREDGQTWPMDGRFGAVWVHPGAMPTPAPATPAPSSPPETRPLPEPVADTRQAIVDAAAAGDWEALEALMAPDFTVSFGVEPGPASAIAYLQDLAADGEEPLALLISLLEGPHGVLAAESAGTHYGWPREYMESEEYFGWRVVIAEDGVWAAFVAGD